MRSLPTSVAMTLLLCFSAPAVSQVTTFEGAVREFCSDADGSTHPKKTTVRQSIRIDDFEQLDNVRLLVAYQSTVPDPDGRGKISAKLILEREDGTQRKLGKFQAVQNRVDGSTQAQTLLDEPVSAGDTLVWNLKFKRFQRLPAGQCFLAGGVLNLPPESCGPYSDAATSDYVLPYRPGQTSVISQSNCGTGSHQGVARHSYDFALPLGTELVASRAGTVVAIDDVHPEGTGLNEHDNILMLEHDDGTFTRYVHIAQNGALVSVGDSVAQGQTIALSGNAGSTSGLPHLHFQAQTCPDRTVCGTLPVTFGNTRAHPDGLELGQAYQAKAN